MAFPDLPVEIQERLRDAVTLFVLLNGVDTDRTIGFVIVINQILKDYYCNEVQ